MRFVWVDKDADSQQWLASDLCRIERADESGLFDFRAYVTQGRGAGAAADTGTRRRRATCSSVRRG